MYETAVTAVNDYAAEIWGHLATALRYIAGEGANKQHNYTFQTFISTTNCPADGYKLIPN